MVSRGLVKKYYDWQKHNIRFESSTKKQKQEMQNFGLVLFGRISMNKKIV
jgi:hypothetical protein